MRLETLRDHKFRIAQNTVVLEKFLKEGKTEAEATKFINNARQTSRDYDLPGEGLKRYLLGSDSGLTLHCN